MPVCLQVWQDACIQEEVLTEASVTGKGHMVLGESEETLGLAVAFEKSIWRNGTANVPCLKVLSGSVSMFCNWGSG